MLAFEFYLISIIGKKLEIRDVKKLKVFTDLVRNRCDLLRPHLDSFRIWTS